MRKAAILFAAMAAAAVLPSTSNAAPKADPALTAQQQTANFIRDGLNPYVATSKPVVKAKAVKRKKK